MTTASTTPAADRTTTRRSPARMALWVLQVLLGVVFIVGSGGPKIVGESYAVQLFTEIGAGQWFRYLVGVLEIAGGIGLLIPRLAGLAATGLIGVMVGATFSQLFLLDEGFWYTPVILGALLAIVVYARRDEVRSLLCR